MCLFRAGTYWDVGGLEDGIGCLMLSLVVIALKKRQTNFEDNDVSWVKVMVMKIVISIDTIPNIIDTEQV